MMSVQFLLLFIFAIQCRVESLPKRWQLKFQHAPKRLKFSSDITGLLSNSLGIPLISLAGLFITQEIYLKLPLEILYRKKPELIDKINVNKFPDGIIVIFPGFGGADRNIAALKNALKDSDSIKGVRRQIIVYDWYKFRGNILRAAINSEMIGDIIGNQIAHEIQNGICNKYKIQFIGVSVGSFAAAKASEKFVKYNNYLRLTLLDPFTLKGFRFNYGINEFGKLMTSEKSFFEQYMNTDDPVPSTNCAIKSSLCYDCTKSKEKDTYVPLSQDVPGHAFPVVYYTKNYHSSLRNIDSHNISKKYQRGEIIVVD